MKYTRRKEYIFHLDVSCSKCGTNLSGKEKYCPGCGHRLIALKTEVPLDDILDALENTASSQTKKKDSFQEASGWDSTSSPECPFGKKTNVGCPSFCNGFCTACVYPTNPPMYKECYFFGDRYEFCERTKGHVLGKKQENHDF